MRFGIILLITLALGFRPIPTVYQLPLPKNHAFREMPSVRTLYDAKTGMKFVWIPGGGFNMGSGGIYMDEPEHGVTVQGFWMSENVVTVAQYERFCKQTGRKMRSAPKFNLNWEKKNHLIVSVYWSDAVEFCKWARMDLSSEAEWEYAARGGLEGKLFPWGDVFDRRKLRCSNREYFDSGGTAAVGSYPPNGYGLYDMAGNVFQWCKDKNLPPKNYRRYPRPKGVLEAPTEDTYAQRGSGWFFKRPEEFRCARQYGFPLDDITYRCAYGFRCVYRLSDLQIPQKARRGRTQVGLSVPYAMLRGSISIVRLARSTGSRS